MIYQKHLKIIESLIISEFKATKQFLVSYWENYNDRETLQEMGTTQARKIYSAKQDLENCLNVSFNEIANEHKADFCLCLRAAMRKLYLETQNFPENPFIKISNLKRIVLMREMLNNANSQYIPYSTKYLINIR